MLEDYSENVEDNSTGRGHMQATRDDRTEVQDVIDRLVSTLARAEDRHEKAMRGQRRFWLGVVVITAIAVSLFGQIGPLAIAQVNQQASPTVDTGGQKSLAEKRKALKAMLPMEAQEELMQFEQQVEWVTQYMQTWDERQAGAVVALMLHRIGQNMNSMPQIEQEMKTMTALMHGMPIVATEMQRMSANMSVITANMGVMTHNMDSTMGRMGRMMPWP